jgi:transposase-like protein
MKNSVHHIKQIECSSSRKRQKKRSRITGRGCRLREAKRDAILRMYLDQRNTISRIARRFEVSNASVTNAAKRAGLTLRIRGRRRQTCPPPEIQEMLLEAWTASYENVARRFGLTRQRVGQVVKRWRDWALTEFGQRALKTPVKTHEPEKRRRVASPHVISFRVPNAVFSLLLARSVQEPNNSSPHEAARSILLETVSDHFPQSGIETLQ